MQDVPRGTPEPQILHSPAVEGDLAASWTVSPDRLTYTFKLYPNVLFHDGSKLTSEDVKASYERIVRPPPGVVSVRRVNYAAIGAIDAPDPLTVVFHLKWPEAAMLENFASEWNAIYSAARLRQDPLFPANHVLGTGAFSFVDEITAGGEYRTLVRDATVGRSYQDGATSRDGLWAIPIRSVGWSGPVSAVTPGRDNVMLSISCDAMNE